MAWIAKIEGPDGNLPDFADFCSMCSKALSAIFKMPQPRPTDLREDCGFVRGFLADPAFAGPAFITESEHLFRASAGLEPDFCSAAFGEALGSSCNHLLGPFGPFPARTCHREVQKSIQMQIAALREREALSMATQAASRPESGGTRM